MLCVCRPVLVDSRLVVTTEFASLHSPLGFSSGPQHWRLPFSSAAEAVEFYGRFERKARALVRLYTAEAGSDGVKVCSRCREGRWRVVVECLMHAIDYASAAEMAVLKTN